MSVVRTEDIPTALRNLASDFRARTPDAEVIFSKQANVDALELIRLVEGAGALVLQAWDDGVRPALTGLAELVVHHRSPTPTHGPDGRRLQAVMIRGPANLFPDIVGGNRVPVLNVNGQLHISRHTTGGLLPGAGLLPETGLSPIERYARGCEILAELIDQRMPFRGDSGLTVNQAADLLLKDHPHLSQGKAKARVSEAASRNKFKTNGETGSKRRIDPATFNGWRLLQRDRSLDQVDEGVKHDRSTLRRPARKSRHRQ